MKIKTQSTKMTILILALILVISLQPVIGVEYENITPQEAKRRIDLDSSIFILDVRSSIEYRDGHINGSVNINVYYINSYAYLLPEENDTGIIVYCDDGLRSQTGSEKVVNLGYTNVSNMLEGYFGWLDQGYPYVTGTETSLITPSMNISIASIVCLSVVVILLWKVKLPPRK